jgi:hypothetical protein
MSATTGQATTPVVLNTDTNTETSTGVSTGVSTQTTSTGKNTGLKTNPTDKKEGPHVLVQTIPGFQQFWVPLVEYEKVKSVVTEYLKNPSDYQRELSESGKFLTRLFKNEWCHYDVTSVVLDKPSVQTVTISFPL